MVSTPCGTNTVDPQALSYLVLLEQQVHLLCIEPLSPEVVADQQRHGRHAGQQVALKQQLNSQGQVISGLPLAILGNG